MTRDGAIALLERNGVKFDWSRNGPLPNAIISAIVAAYDQAIAEAVKCVPESIRLDYPTDYEAGWTNCREEMIIRLEYLK